LTLVLGIDPGTRHLGWGIVQSEGARVSYVASGVISPPAEEPLAERLFVIDNMLRETLALYAPTTAGVESIFFAKDPQAAAKLGHARGVVLLALRRASIAFGEYAPTFIKRTVVGHGLADKRQVALVITSILKLKKPPPADASDALAIAITHSRSFQMPVSPLQSILAKAKPKKAPISPLQAAIAKALEAKAARGA
jgi:crossover junction endodeoxyribonuclease RuvC